MNQDDSPKPIPDKLERYSRQIRFPSIGIEGQAKISQSAALVVGCGALGSVIAETLVRAGVGEVRIVDRDFVELHNLQRQVLFDEADVDLGLPKVVAAQKKLAAINSSVEIQAHLEDVNHRNIATLAKGVDVIVDGTDNFETRFLLNDFALERQIPWVYGGCVGCEGQMMAVIPGATPCLHCLMTEGPPPPGTTAGCDVAGVLGPVVNVVASLQAMEALKIVSGNLSDVRSGLTVIDLWSGRMTVMNLGNLPDRVDCPACRQGKRAWLDGQNASQTAVLCGRNAVQIRNTSVRDIDFGALAERLSGQTNVTQNEYLAKFDIEGVSFTVFRNGRAIISGTDEVNKARSLYARWVGS